MTVPGSILRLQVSLDSGGTWTNIPGEVSSGITISNEQVDTTEKDSQAENGERELVDCGVRSAAVQAAGVTKDSISPALFDFLIQSAFLGRIGYFRVVQSISILYSGLFLVQQFARTGDHNNADRYTLTLESSGPLVSGIDIIVPPSGVYDSSYAVSVRKIFGAYTGKCLRVRRSSDNAEQDIGFVGDWLDEVSLSSFVGSGDGYITAWYNQTPQFGVISFTNPNVLGQPKIVESGSIIRSSVTLRPSPLFTSACYLDAPVGQRWLTASGQGCFMSCVSSTPSSGGGTLGISIFGQDINSGNSVSGISRWFSATDKYHMWGVDLNPYFEVNPKISDASIYPSLPFTDVSISASPSGAIRGYARGAFHKSWQVALPSRLGYVARSTRIGTTTARTFELKIFEVIAQSQAWSELDQLALSQNQGSTFGIPGVY